MVDAYAGYTTLFDRGVVELACLAHIRRTLTNGSGAAGAIDYALRR